MKYLNFNIQKKKKSSTLPDLINIPMSSKHNFLLSTIKPFRKILIKNS